MKIIKMTDTYKSSESPYFITHRKTKKHNLKDHKQSYIYVMSVFDMKIRTDH